GLVRTDFARALWEDAANLKKRTRDSPLQRIGEPDEVAGAVVEGLAAEHFVILPHPQVLTYMQRKTGDYDRWIKGMARLRDQVIEGERG
ncbi:MAG: hypothetical protein WCI21_04630, partial [Alphaproteobacteria bacterium]